MGALTDAVEAERTVLVRCPVHPLLRGGDEVARDLAAMLPEPLRYPSNAISRGLAKAGLVVSGEAIQRHRRGGCACRS